MSGTSQDDTGRICGGDPRLVKVEGDSIRLPVELWEAMDRPEHVGLRSEPGTDCLFVEPPGIGGVSLLSERLVSECEGYLEARVDGAIPAGEYHIVNYHPSYYLMPILPGGDEEGSDRQGFWESIPQYHEHLDPSRQDPGAHRVTDWLVAEILSSFDGASFLEVGCGAGRNLVSLRQHLSHAAVSGIEMNPEACRIARSTLGADVPILNGSIYDMSRLFEDSSTDVVFTSGVLMHVPASRIRSVISQMHVLARRAVVHFELHGPPHSFDFHRYPRDYSELYREFGIPFSSYEVYERGDFRTDTTDSFNHALLVCRCESPSTEHPSGLIARSAQS